MKMQLNIVTKIEEWIIISQGRERDTITIRIFSLTIQWLYLNDTEKIWLLIKIDEDNDYGIDTCEEDWRRLDNNYWSKRTIGNSERFRYPRVQRYHRHEIYFNLSYKHFHIITETLNLEFFILIKWN